jgi:hypothetical protein
VRSADAGIERRGSPRIERPAGVTLELCEWMTVDLKDASMSGAMFTSKLPIEPGNRAQFHTRFGERRFRAQVDVKRLTRQDPTVDWEIGAAFVSMDGESRRNLESFLVTSTH